MADPTYVGGSAQAVYPTSSHVVSNPGVALGNLMVQFMYWYVPFGVTITPPTGWVTIDGLAGFPTAPGEAFEVYTKVADAGDVAAANWTWGFGGGTSVFAALLVYDGDHASSQDNGNNWVRPAIGGATSGTNNVSAHTLQIHCWWDGGGDASSPSSDAAINHRLSATRGGQYIVVGDEILTSITRPVRTEQGVGSIVVTASPAFDIPEDEEEVPEPSDLLVRAPQAHWRSTQLPYEITRTMLRKGVRR